jgi:hypothetical protein
MFAQYTALIFLVSGKSLDFRSRLSPGRVAGLGVPQHVWQRQRAGATGRWRRAGVAGMIAESRPDQGAPHTSTRPDRLFGTQGRDCRNAVGNQQADQHQDLAVQASNWCKARAARHAKKPSIATRTCLPRLHVRRIPRHADAHVPSGMPTFSSGRGRCLCGRCRHDAAP